MERYLLQVRKTEEGISIDEESNMSDFEVMGVLSHLIQERSAKLSKQLQNYENEKRELEG